MNRIPLTVSAETYELIRKHLLPMHTLNDDETTYNDDGTVTFPVTEDTLERVESRQQPGESISDTLARVLSTSH